MAILLFAVRFCSVSNDAAGCAEGANALDDFVKSIAHRIATLV